MKNRLRIRMAALKSRYPDVAGTLKKAVKSVRHVFADKEYKIQGHPPIILDLKPYRNTFFGYYDKSPFNPQNPQLLVFHANTAAPLRKPNPNKPTDIVVLNMGNLSEAKKVGETFAWNWQQGARLHWINGREIIFNVFDEDTKEYRACIRDVFGQDMRTLPFPVQDSFKDEYILSIDYGVLSHAQPDYGYRNKKNNAPGDPDIVYCDMASGASQRIVHGHELTEAILGKTADRAEKCHVNHVQISPDGKKFVFLFRYVHEYKKYHHLCLYDWTGKNWRVLLSGEIVSHYTWIENDELLFWGSHKGKKDYHVMGVDKGSVHCLNTMLSDGHPSVMSPGRIVTDTYPNKHGRRKLLKVEFSGNRIEEIASFFEPPLFSGETRCDFHPHYCGRNGIINIDAVIGNKRRLLLLKC